MKIISPQHYKAKGQEIGIDASLLNNAFKIIDRIQSIDNRLFPILTLNHLSKEVGVPYGYLRKIVAREIHPYRSFYLKKRTPGRHNVRMICAPADPLLRCQQWISQNILSFGKTHSSSYAYHPDSNPIYAAHVHTNAEWLIKVDIHDFFHSISEHKIYDVFRSLGYSRLVSFELARICTIACERFSGKDPSKKYTESKIQHYKSPHIGFLPQGAPSSPMLSNLVMKPVDEKLAKLAAEQNMRFSRYADDIVFSCSDKREAKEINDAKRKILEIINKSGFKPNHRKTVVRGPGTRKIVLGLLIDGSRPRLAREYKDMIRLHLHYLTHENFGPANHAKNRKTSISKIYHHILGMIHWARAVEPTFGNEALIRFNKIKWPPISKAKYFK